MEALGEEIARLSAHITAATYRRLVLIHAYDLSEGWHEAGFRSCAKWLSWKTGISPGAAREKVRVARALAELPALSNALRRGRLSYSIARALTRVATPDNEEELVEVARHSTAAQMERLVSAWTRSDRAEEALLSEEGLRHRERTASYGTDPEDGSWELRGRWDPEAGVVLEKAIEAAADLLWRSAGEEADRPAGARRADALALVAEAALGEGLGKVLEGDEASSTSPAPVVSRADRYQVVVHVSAGTLVGIGDVSAETSGASVEPVPRLAAGPNITEETARRLACDASVVTMVHDGEGRPLDVGRKRRTVPPATRRALNHRDGGCRFPGCGSRFCDAHHIVPWAEGGETNLDNLVLLCRHHHRRVHEDGWTVEMEAGEGQKAASDSAHAGPEVRFHRPDGRLLPAVPPPPFLPDDPVGALEREHEELAIDASSPATRWAGDRMDVDLVLDALAPIRRVEPGTEEGAGEEPDGGENVSAETPPPDEL